jgi:Plasmid pRiA4b ORF-3-like protein
VTKRNATHRGTGRHGLDRLASAHVHHGSTRYGEAEPELMLTDDTTTTLRDLGLDEGEMLAYEYDFGDGWEHVIRIEQVLEADPGLPSGATLPAARGGRRRRASPCGAASRSEQPDPVRAPGQRVRRDVVDSVVKEQPGRCRGVVSVSGWSLSVRVRGDQSLALLLRHLLPCPVGGETGSAARLRQGVQRDEALVVRAWDGAVGALHRRGNGALVRVSPGPAGRPRPFGRPRLFGILTQTAHPTTPCDTGASLHPGPRIRERRR